MVYKVLRDDLKRKYRWFKEPEENPPNSWNDTVKVDKNEGYQVLNLIQCLYDERKWNTSKWVTIVEAYIHTESLKDIQSRKKLLEFLRKNFPNL
ncbi:hypothetical protein CBF23_003310 [Marinomonas agarivorans]|nr:hypothetical protein CBF23_003310 [Marinomonas agarivorans]